MKKFAFRCIAATLAVVLALGMSACSDTEPAVSSADETAATTVTTTTPPPPKYMNLLTGEEELDSQDNRPVAFMIGNYGYTKNPFMQKNIDKADFYVEAETEGGIGRIMAVFGSKEKLPAEIGPVRSARTHFVKIAKAMDVIYCHVGGSTQAKKLIPSLGVNDLDSLTVMNQQLKSANGGYTEHGKVFTLSKINDALAKRKYRVTTSTKSPYTFGTKEGTGLGNAVQVNISSSWKVAFKYDAATGLYTKLRSSLSSDVHKTIDGDSIQVNNVIVMYDTKYTEDQYEKGYHISFTLSSGVGVLVSGGKSRSIKWSRTNDQLTFTESDGTPLTVAKGKTYVCLTDKGQAAATVLQ